MKSTTKIDRTLSLRTHSIRDLTADDLRLAVGGRSGSGGSGHAGGSGHDGSYGGRSGSGGMLSS